MTIEKFARSRPYLYHLTHRDNIGSILEARRIESASGLTERVQHPDRENFLQQRRVENVIVGNNEQSFVIRDQAQIREAALRRALVDGCTVEQFINLLNSKVFFWSTLADVAKHFSTYTAEGPRVLRFNTTEVFALNEAPRFCRFNSGATRPHPYYHGTAAPRGLNSFVLAENFDYLPSKVREVTFSQFCILPESYWITEDPAQEFVQPNP
jgi:hypothetical protein